MSGVKGEHIEQDLGDRPCDVVVIGAGAAGLVAALRAAELGKRTVLLEKNKQAGVKILMSGGTRCNITQNTDNRGIIKAYGTPGRFLHSALAAHSVQDSIAMFEDEGVKTYIEDTGKIFPESDRAIDVRNALVARLKRSGAKLVLQTSVERIEQLVRVDKIESHPEKDRRFRIITDQGEWLANSIILATGGQSFPGCGTTGDGYRFAAELGHTIIPPRPALVPITTNAAWVLDLKGITLPSVTVTILEEGRPLTSRRSSLLFAHFGLTGPAALDVSRVVSGHSQPSSLVAEIDLLPDDKEPQLLEWIKVEATALGKKQLVGILAMRIPRRIAEIILEIAQIPPDRKLAELSKDERQRIPRLLKHLAIPLSGTLGFKKAEVTAGGVPLNEVDSSTMESKLVPGFFLAGEVLDLDGPIGGYNFQAAWSTGWLAGTCA